VIDKAPLKQGTGAVLRVADKLSAFDRARVDDIKNSLINPRKRESLPPYDAFFL